ncbi:unnamed protein product [Anisakis simplex]|uniref:Alpha-carbonic anhydrase domain-containing protein n=1 Tax=Anisakis simplex TaxID=6269 RepID=A0A0M3JQ12_ANISI|nr:unnamed protein product [Anisakis simplex]
MNEPTSFDTNLKNASYGGMTGHAQIAPLMCPLKGSSSAVPLEVPPYQTYSVYLYDTQNVTVR